jgi:hypothetical protein
MICGIQAMAWNDGGVQARIRCINVHKCVQGVVSYHASSGGVMCAGDWLGATRQGCPCQAMLLAAAFLCQSSDLLVRCVSCSPFQRSARPTWAQGSQLSSPLCLDRDDVKQERLARHLHTVCK